MIFDQRFWSKVDIRGEDECWNWKAGKRHGYGAYRLGNKQVSAYRYSYEISIGNIKQGMFVLHRCDNPSCVNPKHLFLGTQKDNMEDMTLKGRRARGEKSNFVKLKE
jgi:hypothetical protein